MSKNRVLITGASVGLGAEFAKQFHARGDDVVLIARRGDLLLELCNKLNSIRQNSATPVVCDLASSEINKVLDLIKNNQIDILVNNVGRGSYGEFSKLEIDSEIGMVELNISVPMRITHAVIPQMKARKSGVIVNLASIAAFQPLPFMATYSATKDFNLMHSLALRHELSSYGIRVIAVCPGPVATEFGKVAKVPGDRFSMPDDPIESVVKKSIAAIDKNKPFVVPSKRAWAVSFFSRILPRNFVAWCASKAMK